MLLVHFIRSMLHTYIVGAVSNPAILCELICLKLWTMWLMLEHLCLKIVKSALHKKGLVQCIVNLLQIRSRLDIIKTWVWKCKFVYKEMHQDTWPRLYIYYKCIINLLQTHDKCITNQIQAWYYKDLSLRIWFFLQRDASRCLNKIYIAKYKTLNTHALGKHLNELRQQLI